MSVDFPRAWQISKSFPAYWHESLCSYRKTFGALLCDCDVLLKHREVCYEENFYGRDGKILEKGKE